MSDRYILDKSFIKYYSIKKYKNYTLLFLSTLFFLLSFVSLTANNDYKRSRKQVEIDNKYIQTYKKKFGIWEKTSLNVVVHRLAKKFGSSIKDILSINGAESVTALTGTGNWIFFPYSKSYYNKIKLETPRKFVSQLRNNMVWPLEGVNITSAFGKRGETFHSGLDISCGTGTIIVAPLSGKVVFSSSGGDMGFALTIEHDNGLLTRYGHNSVLLVKKGDYVQQGQIIALSGSTGFSTGPHLHFEVRYLGIGLNPAHFLPPFIPERERLLRLAQEKALNTKTKKR